jgi:pseudomonalisin
MSVSLLIARRLPLLAALVLCFPALAQRRVRPSNRINSPVDRRVTVPRGGEPHPLARPELDEGPAAPDLRMDRMVLMLARDAEQQRALDELVAAQHDPESPLYQRWLTPEEFGLQFGISDSDIDQITAWLRDGGFEVEPVTADRTHIVFSGTAWQVADVFQTEIRTFRVGGERHYANALPARVPRAIADVVAGVLSLNSFRLRPLHARVGAAAGAISALWTTSGGAHYLAPGDFARIYDSASLQASGIDGTGQSIAIVGRTNLKLADVQKFRSSLGLPAKDPEIVINGTDPGIVSTDEQGEATLDVEWAGAAAPNASIKLVVSKSTAASDGVVLSSQYVVSRNLAPIVSVSFGACEAAMGTSGNQFWNNLWQQAAAQGITVLAASGDSGAAGCDAPDLSTAKSSKSVNGLCSTPYSTCVGGTQFDAGTSSSQSWSATNGTGNTSALGYIPETAWNESAGTTGGTGLWSTGGGVSTVYQKPSWQTGSTLTNRAVPDVSLNASAANAYVTYMNGQYYLMAGTSAAAPAFAGLVALAAQRTGSRPGNVNPALYGFAARQAAGGAAVFHDIVKGNNSVPGMTGYTAAAGFDAATGLGSVDASLLVNNWTATAAPSFDVAVSPASLSVAQSASAAATVKVTATGGFGSPVSVTVTGLPAGVTSSVSPALLPSGPGSATLTVTASSSAAAGSSTFTVAVAGGGLTRTVSVPLTVTAGCTFTINPTTASIGAAASANTVQVTTGSACSWTATSPASWLTISAGASGKGSGSMTWNAAANTATAPRTASLTIAGQTLAVTQSGTVFTISPASAAAPAAASTGSVAVTAPSPTAAWMAASGAAWLTITSGASGRGNGTVAYAVAANTGAERTGSLTVAGLTFTVKQAAQACAFTLSASSANLAAGGGTYAVQVTAGGGCAWKASSNASWMTVKSGASATGAGGVSYTVAANTGAARTGTLSIADQTFSVTQSGATCKYTVGAPTIAANASGYSMSFAVTTQAGCSWTATSSVAWVTLKGASPATGGGTALFQIATNSTRTTRTGTLVVAGSTFTITQR